MAHKAIVIVNTMNEKARRDVAVVGTENCEEGEETRQDVKLIKRNSTSSYFFLAAFSADFVTLPPLLSVFSTDLMIPTATVCLMSRTAKRPSGGYSL